MKEKLDIHWVASFLVQRQRFFGFCFVWREASCQGGISMTDLTRRAKAANYSVLTVLRRLILCQKHCLYVGWPCSISRFRLLDLYIRYMYQFSCRIA